LTAGHFCFAYGSNMDPDQRVLRAAPTGACRARLPGYRLAFNKRSASGKNIYANIVPDPGGVVWGILFACSAGTMRALDLYEGVAGGHYDRVVVRVIPDSGPAREAFAYIAGEQYRAPAGTPSAGYLRRVLRGARAHGLPPDYIAAIERLALHPTLPGP
jgi:gamma-glutamylcyclotransferase (GGCT)/AIG2-like uncharacterized protein YtfP